ncbi:TBC1 domain family member 15-like [Camellia sinensis]|uniref:TBC1 domain family member 15-like n=1 Tax=Camellia sinensis TaxID=4442 RepID=UPI001035CBDB|nr:TBC1 domain family member 15-like [Camellia sinensis]
MLYVPIVLVFYESEANQTKLWNILAIYAWVDNSIGYVQGMNDICSPMVILMENEADTFWCFERAMHRLRKFQVQCTFYWGAISVEYTYRNNESC